MYLDQPLWDLFVTKHETRTKSTSPCIVQKRKFCGAFVFREIFIIHVGATLSPLSFVYNKHMIFSNSITIKYPCLLTPPLNCIL